jgi:hypothetical protein
VFKRALDGGRTSARGTRDGNDWMLAGHQLLLKKGENSAAIGA